MKICESKPEKIVKPYDGKSCFICRKITESMTGISINNHKYKLCNKHHKWFISLESTDKNQPARL